MDVIHPWPAKDQGARRAAYLIRLNAFLREQANRVERRAAKLNWKAVQIRSMVVPEILEP